MVLSAGVFVERHGSGTASRLREEYGGTSRRVTIGTCALETKAVVVRLGEEVVGGR